MLIAAMLAALAFGLPAQAEDTASDEAVQAPADETTPPVETEPPAPQEEADEGESD